jgi:flotillin
MNIVAFAPIIGVVSLSLFGLWLFTTVMHWRVVVSTNAVHIVQSGRHTISYGSGLAAGNVYYRFPASMPRIGVTVTTLPVSVFDLTLKDYNGYDIGRVPFMLDLMGFFRIQDTNLAAARVPSFDSLKLQMVGILQGATRTILATSEIEQILQDRAIFGEKFTHEVGEQLLQWGVAPVKNIELMDIRDAQGSKVIDNIMAKKSSLIQAQSRMEVASNNQNASVREIEAKQAVMTREQEALEQVGVRTAAKDQVVGIRNQEAQQAVQQAQAETNRRTIEAQTALDVGHANITKSVEIVQAEQDKAVNITKAEGTKQQAILVAEGAMEAMKRNAEGVQAEGVAKGEAEKAMQLASVTAQTTLAEKIGENEGYQHYLISVRQLEAGQAVGMEQARALEKAEIKIISNAGNPPDGITTVMDMFSPKGGLRLGAMLEAFKQTPVGETLLNGGAK